MQTKKIPVELQNFIDKYFHLDIVGKKVICPYFINKKGGFLNKPVFAGKGDPLEIEVAAANLFKHIDLMDKDEEFIRSQMVENYLGVDCSGLVYQIYNKWLRDIENKGELKNYLSKTHSLNPRKLVSRLIKPQSSVSADMFTSGPISKKVDVKDIRPGDLIRTRGGKHVLFITEVEYENDIPKKIIFVNSATYYKRSGVRYGEIILDESLDLLKSEWRDNDPNEDINYAYKGFRELTMNNGTFRPNLPITSN